MICHIDEDNILIIRSADLPTYKKEGSKVRNTFFWSLKAIACHTPYEKAWEFDQVVWTALSRMLVSFAESGYLGSIETILEFKEGKPIPDELRSVATFL